MSSSDIAPALPRRAVRVITCGAVSLLAFLALAGPAPRSEGVRATHELSPPIPGQVDLAKLLARHDCSTTSLGPGVVPGSSLVLQDNRVRHVSFDTGWDVYTGKVPGTLLAVCRVSI